MLKLHIQDDEGKTTVVPFTGDDITIGRQEDSTIQLTERNVSRCHARLYRKANQIYVEDIASSYGTRVNGIKIAQSTEIKVQDVIQVGDYRIQYRTELGEYRSNPNRGGDTAIVDISGLEGGDGKQRIPQNKHALLHATGRGLDDEFQLTSSPIVVGKAPDSDWQIDHPSVSHHHAEIRFENGQYVLADLGTAAGIRVNGEPYQQVLLTPGDEITIGKLKIQFLMGLHSTSDPSVWETAVMDVVPGTATVGGRGKGVLAFAAVAVVAAIGLSVLYFSKYAGGPVVPPEAPSQVSTEPSVETSPSNLPTAPTTTLPEEAQIDYIEKAKDHWKNGNKSAAFAALNRAKEDPGDAEEALLLKRSFDLYEKMDLLYQLTADGQYETVLDELAQITIDPDAPLYGNLNKRFQDLKTVAEEGALDTLYERGIKTIRKGKTRDAKRIIAMMQAIDPENENAAKLARKLKSKSDAPVARPRRSRPTRDPVNVATKPKLKPKPKPKPVIAASGGPNDWYKEARKARYSDVRRAISLLKKVVSSRPGHFRAHKLLGMIYQSQGNKRMAVKHIEKALTIRSDPGLQQFLERLQ